MIILYILLGIAVIITLLLFLDVNLILKFDNETQVRLRVLFVSLDVMKLITGTKPTKAKKKKGKPTDTAKPKKKKRPEFEDFLMFVDLINSMVQMIYENLTANLKLDLKRFKAVIASPEADKTAYMYGVVSNAVAIMLELIPNYVRKFKKNDKNIAVYPDYTAEKCTFEAHVTITLKVYHILIIAMRALGILNENARENIRRKGLKS